MILRPELRARPRARGGLLRILSGATILAPFTRPPAQKPWSPAQGSMTPRAEAVAAISGPVGDGRGGMGLTAGVLLVLLGVAVVVGTVISVRHVLKRRRSAQRAWVERAAVDRRQHDVPVTFDRRAGPRRREDIAKKFLSNVIA